jgi:transposase InsO family protein
VIHKLITQWAGKASIKQLCRVLQVSRSGFYAARQRAGQAPVTCTDSLHVKAAFEASGGSYGSRRLSAALRKQGVDVGRHRCRTLMKANQLRPKWKRKFVHTTNSRHSLPVAPNVLQRKFTPAKPNVAWVSDLTYVRTRSGWLYLACVMDLYSRKIVGWAMAASMPAQLVCDALQMAIASRRPAPGLIVHSDQGSQYASAEHSRLLQAHGLIPSMSRKGNCWDNAVMERFFLNLKMERVWHRDYANHAEARLDIAEYIVSFYNSIRLHSTLGYCAPAEYERREQLASD